MPQTSKPTRSHTFQNLRDWVLKKAVVSSHFDFLQLGPSYVRFWEDVNRLEFDRGYDPEEYTKPNTLGLWQMKLLTKTEFKEWKKRFQSFHKS